MSTLLDIADTIYQKQWLRLDKQATELITLLTLQEKREYKFELLFSYYYNSLGNFRKSNEFIYGYWQHTKHDCTYFFAAAMMAAESDNHNRVISEIVQGFKGDYSLFSKMILGKISHSFMECGRALSQ